MYLYIPIICKSRLRFEKGICQEALKGVHAQVTLWKLSDFAQVVGNKEEYYRFYALPNPGVKT